MPMERTPLTAEQLPDSIAPYFVEGAASGKVLLLARGLAPGLGPLELATGLFQASCHENDKIAAAAVASARDLPDSILSGALAAALAPQVLDFYAELCRQKPQQIQTILLNRATADETFEHLARTLKQDALVEIIAKNEERLLRHPDIIKELYLNPATRMSTANRCVELAVRNEIVIDIPAYREIAAGIGHERTYDDPMDQALADDATDASFQHAVDQTAGVEEIPGDRELETNDQDLKKITSLLGLSISQRIRLATIGSGYQRALLLRDPNRIVAIAAIKSPLVKETEVIRVAQSKSANDDVIRHIALNRDWLKMHAVKVALVSNPKCPLPTAMRLLPHLRLLELKNLARSRNISNTLRSAAKNMLSKKG
ncbi:MAG: hypothetical protein ABI333_17320 [bacterium]